ncbi:MAG: diguanylate cyclase [Clostridia bacterium]|nr:diguanylate cyclase [Clostridia bacterium]
MINRKYIILFSALILVLGMLANLTFSMERAVHKSGGVTLYPEDFTNGIRDLTARVLDKNDPAIDSYSTTVRGSDLSEIHGDNLHILVFRLNAQAYEVYFNGIHLGTSGDMESARSHIYNGIGNFVIHKEYIKEVNTLTINTHSLYMIGLEQSPVGIVCCDTARKITEDVTFRTQGMTMMGVGILILGIIITLMMIFLSEKKNHALIFFMLSVVFLSIYSLEFMYIPHIAISYIWFRKIIILALFACIFFLGLSFSKYFNSRQSVILSSVLFGLVLLSALLVGNLVLFKQMYNVFVPAITFNFIIWIIVAAKQYKKMDEAVIFIWSFVNLLLLAAADSIQLLVLGGIMNTSIIMHVMIFSLILISLFYIEMNKRNIKIRQESSQRSHFYQQAITDQLTDTFNKKHVLALLSDETPPYTIAMIDIDSFKHVNDTYGHPAGDYILKHVSHRMKSEFRDTDIIGRYGGDEFIVILLGCSEKHAFDIMNRFRMHVEFDKISHDGRQIPVTLSIGIAYCDKKYEYEETIKRADEALYRAKETGRNRVSL